MKRIFRWLFAALLLLHCELILAKCVLVVGGAGFIGSHVNEQLHKEGYDTIILDNLSQGNQKAVRHGLFIEGDITDSALLDQLFTTHAIDAVMHFAAFLDVGESVQEPLKYYQNNVAGTLNLLAAMHRHGVNTFVFSSTAAIFGIAEESCVAEEHACLPINPYGRSKLMVETILHDLDQAYGFRFCALRYFNAAAGDPEGKLKSFKKKDLNLIPIVLRSIQAGRAVTIFGTDYPTPDGTCIRDYIHVEDLASAHVIAMKALFSGASSTCYNLGTGRGFSVREVIAAAEKITGKKAEVIEGERRPGDPAILIADASKAREELSWRPRFCLLEEIIEHAWLSMQ